MFSRLVSYTRSNARVFTRANPAFTGLSFRPDFRAISAKPAGIDTVNAHRAWFSTAFSQSTGESGARGQKQNQNSQQEQRRKEGWNSSYSSHSSNSEDIPKFRRRLLWGSSVLSYAALYAALSDGEETILGAQQPKQNNEPIVDLKARMEQMQDELKEFGADVKEVLKRAATFGIMAFLAPSLFFAPGDSLDAISAFMTGSERAEGRVQHEPLAFLRETWDKVREHVLRNGLSSSAFARLSEIPEDAIVFFNSAAGAFYFQPGNDYRQSRICWGRHNFAASRAIILATNLAVFLAWRNPRWHDFMNRHFMCSLSGVVNQKRLHTLLTASFSHRGLMHLAFNMFAINSFLAYFERWSDRAFWTFYLGTNILGMLGHVGLAALSVLINHRPSSWFGFKLNALNTPPALGASSAACGMFAFIALIDPTARFNIMFIPYPIEGMSLLKGALVFDGIGACLQLAGNPITGIAHAAHLLGYAGGYLAYQYVLYRRAQLRRLHSRKF